MLSFFWDVLPVSMVTFENNRLLRGDNAGAGYLLLAAVVADEGNAAKGSTL